MYLDLVSGQIESSFDFDNYVFPITNEIMDSFFSKLIDHLMDGTLEKFLDAYDGSYEEGFWEYIHLLKSGVI